MITISIMSLYSETYSYFEKLSLLPRRPRHEEEVRKWLIDWAEGHKWTYEEDKIGNLLIRAPGTKPTTICLQSHMDMVCVADHEHDFTIKGIDIIDEDDVLHGNGTTLGADNGIGVAAMMAIAEIKNRPNLELVFTMAEEVGLIGAFHIELPLTATHGLNLDWCDSRHVGIGCGGTLLMEYEHAPKKISKKSGKTLKIRLSGLRGGHSGVEIEKNNGNALIELSRIFSERDDIIGFSEIKGGDADNAIPRSAKATVLFTGELEEFEKWLEKREKKIQKKTETLNFTLSCEETEKAKTYYGTDIFAPICQIGTGVEIMDTENNLPLSSWNLGKIRFREGILTWCYFVRTNIVGGITPMKTKIQRKMSRFTRQSKAKVALEMSSENPVWYADPDSPFVRSILRSIEEYNGKSIPAITMHATMEAGILSERYPNIQWVSLGATVHGMHTTHEHIYKADLEEFCGRMEQVIKNI